MTHQVSVVVCLYNPSLLSALRTIYSVIRQKDIQFNIVITDDASSTDYSNQFKAFFKECRFNDYHIIIHETNVGTVENIYDGVSTADGEYVYLISAGDFLYDPYVLRDMYKYADRNSADFVFGDACYYNLEGSRVNFYSTKSPTIPKLFNLDERGKRLTRFAFFVDNDPVGVTYLRKRTLFLHYLKDLLGSVKYIEDRPTTAMLLMDNKRLHYYHRLVAWYEFGHGVSTSSSPNSKIRMQNDKDNIHQFLFDRYWNSRMIRFFTNNHVESKIKYLDLYFLKFAYSVVGRGSLVFRRKDNLKINELKTILSFGKNKRISS